MPKLVFHEKKVKDVEPELDRRIALLRAKNKTNKNSKKAG